jgi:hypothetical protein
MSAKTHAEHPLVSDARSIAGFALSIFAMLALTII